MPPILADRIAHENAHLFSHHHVAERDGVLTWLGAVWGVVLNVASVTQDAHPLIAGIAAGVLTAATEALQFGADEVDAPFGGEQTVPRLHENSAVNQGKAVCVGEVVENFPINPNSPERFATYSRVAGGNPAAALDLMAGTPPPLPPFMDRIEYLSLH